MADKEKIKISSGLTKDEMESLIWLHMKDAAKKLDGLCISMLSDDRPPAKEIPTLVKEIDDEILAAQAYYATLWYHSHDEPFGPNYDERANPSSTWDERHDPRQGTTYDQDRI